MLHAGNIPAAFAAIFKGAFNLNAAGGGALGYGISQTITWGFKRGAFSNEAGLGSAVMVNLRFQRQGAGASGHVGRV